jgi:hypothetical protein
MLRSAPPQYNELTVTHARRLTYAWFHLPETPPATVAGRLAAQLPVYRQFTNPGLRVRGGQTLEIATYRALQRLDADFFGRFKPITTEDVLVRVFHA